MVLVCKYCGKEYKTSHKNSTYCSRACRNKDNGHPHSEEHKKKISESMKGKNAGNNNAAYGRFGKDSWTYGTKRTDECCQRLSELKLKLFQEKKESGEWIPAENSPYPEEWTEELKTNIRKRDLFVCQLCGLHGHDVHHINYDKEDCREDNLITLCRSCHSKTNFNRDEWQAILEGYMEIKNEN